MEHFVEFCHVSKVYEMGEVRIDALRDASFTVDKGEICVIVGPSGAGKTTLLNILGGMDTLTSGNVHIDGKDISAYSGRQLTAYRRYDVGFVFQFYNLIQNLTALENVEMATEICKNPLRPEEILARVGLAERAGNFPSQLSGGEQQRVSIARALAKNPKLLLCDEPTGALDSHTSDQIMLVLRDHIDAGAAGILVTHEARMAAWADRTVFLRDGRIVDRSRGDSLRDLLADTAPRI